jgi:hypothetical protein
MRMPVQKRSSMQNGSLIKANRRNGQEVWEFRWRDRTSGKAVYRRIVLGSAQQFPTEIEARAAAAGIVLEINVNDPRVQAHALTISQLAEHYRHRELSPDNAWKSYSTKKGYENYLKRWIVPKWGEVALCKIKPIEVSCGYASFPWRARLARRSRTSRACCLIMLAGTNYLMIIPSSSFGRAPSAAGYRSSFSSMKSGSF